MKQRIIHLMTIVVIAIGCQPSTDSDSTTTELSPQDSAIIEQHLIQDPMDQHSYAQPGEATITHLNLNVSVDFDKRQISGQADYRIRKSDYAKKIVFDTYDLTISSVWINDSISVPFELGDKDEILGQPLIVLITNETKSIKINYHSASDAKALQWLRPEQTAGKKQPFLFTQSQAILARSWIPIQDSPGIRFTYRAQVQVPTDLMALMSAVNPQSKNDSGVYSFQMDQPIPAYLMALAVGDVEFRSIGERTGVYSETALLEEALYEFGELENMLEKAEELYGPYQWGRYDILVLPPSFPFGGMENPMLTFATPTILAGDRSLTALAAHELAHSWSGNLVTNATWNDFWLNEGFTVYFEHRIMEALYGADYAEMLALLSKNDLVQDVEEMMQSKPEDTRLKLDLAGRNPDEGVTSIAYDKGYFFLRMLEKEVGREEFDTFLNKYFADNAFKSMTTEDFIDYMQVNLFEKNTRQLDEDLYGNWIYQEGLPDNLPQPIAERFNAVTRAVEEWKTGSYARTLRTKSWSTHEWLYFIRSLPEELPTSRLAELDRTFKFTSSNNSEITCAWLTLAVKNQYSPAYNKLEQFLINTGRRKFLVPLYKALLATEGGEKRAKAIYEKARPNYHYVATNTLDDMLNREAEESKTKGQAK